MLEHDKANDMKWSERSGSYDWKRFDYFRMMQKTAISHIAWSKDSRFLDLGCGTGWAVQEVARLLGKNGRVVGIDISAGMIAKAKENAAGLERVRFIRASAEDLPLSDGSQTVILCTNSFHHYLNPDKALNEAFRVLKKDGELYILDVTADDFLIRWIDSVVAKREKEHVHFYSSKAYCSMFQNAGFHYVGSRKLCYPLKLHQAKKGLE